MLALMCHVLGHRSHNYLHNPPPGWSWDAQWPRGCSAAGEAPMLCSSCRPEGDLWPRTHPDAQQTSKQCISSFISLRKLYLTTSPKMKHDTCTIMMSHCRPFVHNISGALKTLLRSEHCLWSFYKRGKQDQSVPMSVKSICRKHSDWGGLTIILTVILSYEG